MPYRILSDTSFPVHVWGGELEPEAEQQLRNAATLPILFHHLAVMPDVHFGMGATVGTVLASRNAVIPAAVGVDIGCGVTAVRLSLDSGWITRRERLAEIRRSIERAIPVGFAQRKPGEVSPEAGEWGREKLKAKSIRAPLEKFLREKALLQIGTLGGGNHFIEICRDEQERLWVMLHSGSRHIGKRIADYYIGCAKSLLNKANKLSSLPDRNLAYFTDKQPEFHDYLHDLFWAQDYAAFNREEMMRRVLGEIAYYALGSKEPGAVRSLAKERIDCHHNYVALESHFGSKVYVTRKGAVQAGKGQAGLIPGSMGTASYIVEGLGYPGSFNSCAHGAGRAMSRTQAKRRFKVADLERQTEGVECRKDKGVLDEIPQAYKDIEQVMAAQEELVTIRHKLKQMICVKG